MSEHASRWRPLIISVVLLLFLGAVAEFGSRIAFSGDRRAVVRVMASLRKGMPRVEAEQIVDREAAHFFVLKRSPDGLLLWAHTGLAAAWGVQVRFTDGELASATVSTEDGPYHPKEVPANIQ